MSRNLSLMSRALRVRKGPREKKGHSSKFWSRHRRYLGEAAAGRVGPLSAAE